MRRLPTRFRGACARRRRRRTLRFSQLASIMNSAEPRHRGVGAATNSTLMNISSMMALTVAFVLIGTTVNVSNLVTSSHG